MSESDIQETSTLKLETELTCPSCLTNNILIQYRTTDLFNPDGFLDVSCGSCGEILDMEWGDVKVIWDSEIARTKR